jgi:hypothetical protein
MRNDEEKVIDGLAFLVCCIICAIIVQGFLQ